MAQVQKDDSIFNPLEQWINKDAKKVSTYYSFYPSDASCVVGGKVVGPCLRKQYWRWMKEPVSEGTTYKSYLSMKLGNACEQVFLDIYEKMGLLKGRNLPFRTEVMGLKISGRIDGLTKKNELIECKSAYGTAFFNSVNKAPKEEHLCQIMLYLACLGLDIAIIPYICRDNAAKRIGYKMSKKEIENLGITASGILNRWKRLQKCLDEKKIPDRDYDKKNWNCRYCVYKSKCYDLVVF